MNCCEIWTRSNFTTKIRPYGREKHFRLGYGRLFALYVALYTVGRVWVEALRVDHANRILGLRLNIWTSIVIFAAAVTYLLLARRGQPGAVTSVQPNDDVSLGNDRERLRNARFRGTGRAIRCGQLPTPGHGLALMTAGVVALAAVLVIVYLLS